MTATKKSRKTAAAPKQGRLIADEHEVMQRFHPDGFANRIAGLDIGESESRSVRLELHKVTKEIIEREMEQLRGTMAKAAHHAGKRSGNKYVTEIGDFMTRSRDIILTSVVTRLE